VPEDSAWTSRQLRLAEDGPEVVEHSMDLQAAGGALPGLGCHPKILRLLRGLFSRDDVETALKLVQDLPFAAVEPSDNPVVTQFQMLVSRGVWRTEATELARFIEPIVEERLLPYMRRELACPSLVVEAVMLRQYEADDPRYAMDDPTTRKTIHFDFDAFATAVVDLTPRESSGLFVGFGTEEQTQFFVPFESPGDAAVHKWDVAHGVRLQPGHARVSLIVWCRPALDVEQRTTSWYAEDSANGNHDAQYKLGMDAEEAGDDDAAKDYYYLAAKGDHTYARNRLNRLVAKMGNFFGAMWEMQAIGRHGSLPPERRSP